MRFPRVKAKGHGFYHCISRVVEGRFIFATSGPGSIGSARFTKLMRCLEAFSGVRVLTYVLMSNHFHLLCEVPEPISLTEAEVLKRIEAGYGEERLQSVQEELARCCQQPDGSVQIQRLLDGYRKRMYDLSVFIKELKGRFAQWYNQRHERYGVLWAERFKSVLLDEQALAAVAAYIELNPVRAGLCADPKDYRYCGYAEALAKGSRLARHGIRTILGQSETMCWQRISQEYRKCLFIKGSLGSANKRPAFDLAAVRHVVEQQQGELPLPHLLLCRIRYFTDGVILGSQGFVQSHYDRLKQQLGYKRQRTPKHLDTTGSAGLWVFRDPRVRAVH
jgi:REP element-mobilizing transposase RayT